MITTLDKFGRVIIPRKIRERLGIHPGTNLNISEEGSHIIIKPVKADEPLIEKDGILVFTGKINGKVEESISKDRKDRINKLLPKKE